MRTVPTTSSAATPNERERDDRDGDVVDGVAVIAGEDSLLGAEHLAAQQRRGFAPLPRLGRELHLVFAGGNAGNGSKIMRTPSRS